jgi:DNA-binding MarR family transcriptional regulator
MKRWSCVDSWDQIMDSTRHLPEDLADLVEIVPDQDYRFKSGKVAHQYRADRGGRLDRGHKGDVEFLQSLKRLTPNDGEIYPLGVLLDLCERLLAKRQPAHARLRRMWRKGMIRRYKLPEKNCGVWYRLQPQQDFFLNRRPPPKQITIEELF